MVRVRVFAEDKAVRKICNTRSGTPGSLFSQVTLEMSSNLTLRECSDPAGYISTTLDVIQVTWGPNFESARRDTVLIIYSIDERISCDSRMTSSVFYSNHCLPFRLTPNEGV